jgi:hypothetical protein
MRIDVDEEIRDLERRVAGEMKLLSALPAVAPQPECMQRVKAAVVLEARRIVRQQRCWRYLRLGFGAAAALLLVVGWLTTSRAPSTRPRIDTDAVLNEWGAALDESNARLARLLSGEGSATELVSGDEDTELEDLFRGLDDFLNRFEQLEP